MIHKNSDPRKGMKVPDGFFDEIEDSIMEQVIAARVIPFWSKSKFMAIAAVFMLLLASLFIMRLNTEVETPAFSKLSDDLNWEYLFENYEDVTYDEIAGFEETDDAISAMEAEYYGYLIDEEILDEIDLETLENLYK